MEAILASQKMQIIEENDKATASEVVNTMKEASQQEGVAAADGKQGERYQRLKKKYKALKQEYVRVLQSWEDTHKHVKQLSKERSFLREKLENFIKMQIPQPS